MLRTVLMDSDKRRAQVERLDVVETGRRRCWSEDEKLKIVLESCKRCAGTLVEPERVHEGGPGQDALKDARKDRWAMRGEVLVGPERRLRWGGDEKARIVRFSVQKWQAPAAMCRKRLPQPFCRRYV